MATNTPGNKIALATFIAAISACSSPTYPTTAPSDTRPDRPDATQTETQDIEMPPRDIAPDAEPTDTWPASHKADATDASASPDLTDPPQDAKTQPKDATRPATDTANPPPDTNLPPACKADQCNDANPCTSDSCDPAKGCQHKAKAGACNDSNNCTINDICAATTCSGKAKNCDDGKPCTADSCISGKGCVHGPGCALPKVCGAGGKKNTCAKPPPLPYPKRTPWTIKAIQPDFWPNRDEIIGNKAGGIAANLVWSAWQPKAKAPPCGKGTEVAYDGFCFKINKTVESEVAK